jgi:nicotinamidase-related amidase
MKAVVFVDVQKDFIDGALRNEKAIEVTPKIVEFAKECVEKGYKLYATRDTHEKTKFNYFFEGDKREAEIVSGYLSTLEGDKLPVEHCIECTDGWMIDNRLMGVLDGKCTFVNKPTFGSFDLAEIIAEDFVNENIDEIILCGFVSSICVISNALLLRAKFPNKNVTIYDNLCADLDDIGHNSAMTVARNCQIDIKSYTQKSN